MPLTLFDGHHGCAIAVADDAPLPARFAAEELRRYLSAATGADFPLTHDPRGATILLGSLADAHQRTALSEDGYQITNDGTRLRLRGGSPRATLYAAYALLETLGFRWPEPGDDVIPACSRISYDAPDLVAEPVYSYRSVVTFPFTVERGIKEIDWLAKQRLNWVHPVLNAPHRWERERCPELVMPEIAKRGLHTIWGGHTFQTWIPSDVYFTTHPEFFALVDGARKPQENDRGSLCLSNPALADEVARNILNFAAANPGIDAVDLWMNDTVDWCECAACRALEGETDYERYPQYFRFEGTEQRARAYFTFINAVARLVAQGNPELRLSPLAYARTCEPPDDLVLEPNILTGFTNFLRTRNTCLLHPGDARNAAFLETIDRWQARTDQLFIYEYFSYPLTYNAFTEHLTNIADLAAELRYYPTIGLRRISTEGAGEGYWRPLIMYVYARLLWDPAQNPAAIMDDFCRHAYGPAADAMRAFWQAQEAREPFLIRRDACLAQLAEIAAEVTDPVIRARLDHLHSLLRRPDRITKWPDGTNAATAATGLEA